MEAAAMCSSPALPRVHSGQASASLTPFSSLSGGPGGACPPSPRAMLSARPSGVGLPSLGSCGPSLPPHQGAALTLCPLSLDPAHAALRSLGARCPSCPASPSPGRSAPPPVQAVFQYLPSLPSLPWPLWNSPRVAPPSSAPAPAAPSSSGGSSSVSAAPGKSLGSSSSSPLAGPREQRDPGSREQAGSGSSQGTSSKGSKKSISSSNSSASSRGSRAAAASHAVAAAIVASELTDLGMRVAQADAASSQHQQQQQQQVQEDRRSSSWLVSFLVNYSLVVSAWWQFKHTAPAAIQLWIQEHWHLLPTLHLPMPKSLLPLPLPLPLALPIPLLPLLPPGAGGSLHLTHLSVPLHAVASALSSIPPLPFNPLLAFAFSPGALLRGLRAPWAPKELTAGQEEGQQEDGKEGKPENGGAAKASREGQEAVGPLIVHGGETDEEERVESVVVDDFEPGMIWGQRHKDIVAEEQRGSALAPYGLSFSAAGLLFPYHLGVTQFFQDRGLLTEDVPLAGASAGAIVCASIAAGVSMHTALEYTKVLSKDCRKNGTAFRLGAVLREILVGLLPENAHELCNGRIRVAVTQVFGRPRGLLVDQFESKEDLINALFTSSFIPGYLAPSPITRFRNRICVDGGLTLFIPPTASHNTVRICAFPASSLGLSNVAISPDLQRVGGSRSMRQLFEWAIEPASDDDLDLLFEEGYKDAELWLASLVGGSDALGMSTSTSSSSLIMPEEKRLVL